MFETYRTGDLIRCLGVTRDTLRFYEEKGLLSPSKDQDNQYRSFDILDVYKLMIIDFMKKRGMSLQTIGQLLQQGDIEDIRSELDARRKELLATIEEATATLKRIEETESFSSNLISRLGVFSERPMPPLRILGELSEFSALEEYAQAKELFAAESGDMLSKIVRFVSFDKEKILSTRMLISSPVDPIPSGKEAPGTVAPEASVTEAAGSPHILLRPDCLYYVAEECQSTSGEGVDLIHSMHLLSRAYADEHGYLLTGEAFATIRLITFNGDATRSFIEIYIPFYQKIT
jgi:DNA-binding transcriptional MerR regulator